MCQECRTNKYLDVDVHLFSAATNSNRVNHVLTKTYECGVTHRIFKTPATGFLDKLFYLMTKKSEDQSELKTSSHPDRLEMFLPGMSTKTNVLIKKKNNNHNLKILAFHRDTGGENTGVDVETITSSSAPNEPVGETRQRSRCRHRQRALAPRRPRCFSV